MLAALVVVSREEVKQPSMLAGGELRPYQIDGIRFLVSLWNNNMNGEMRRDLQNMHWQHVRLGYVPVPSLHSPFLLDNSSMNGAEPADSGEEEVIWMLLLASLLE